MQKSDLLKILEEIRGTGIPEGEYTDGIYWELTKQLHNGNPGIYGDILAIYTSFITGNEDFERKYEEWLANWEDSDYNRSDITYGAGAPTATLNPVNGTNAIYVNTDTGVVYTCTDATIDNNVWGPIGTYIRRGAGVPTATENPGVVDALYVDTLTNNIYICTDAAHDANTWTINGATTIIYGAGEPLADTNPVSGTNSIYVNTSTNKSYICIDATPDANVWIINGSGQFSDVGTSIGSGVAFTAAVSGVEDIVIKSGTNGFSVNDFTLVDGASLTVEDGATYTII